MTPESNGSFENCTNSTTSLPAQDGTYMAEIQTNDLDNMQSLESVNLWNAFPDPTFNVPIPAQDGTYMAETFTNDLDNMESEKIGFKVWAKIKGTPYPSPLNFTRLTYCPFVSINPALKSVNLWNAFPDPTFSVPIPAQDGTYMAETLTNDLDNMEYVAPMFHCPTPNVYHPFFAINLNITFTPATPLSIRNTHSSLPLAPLSSPITLSSGYIPKPHATDTFKKEKIKTQFSNQWIFGAHFPTATFNASTSAQDGTMAETQTNVRNNMEYIAPRFHCSTPNVYDPFFTMNLNITFTLATPRSICNTHPPLPLAPHPSSVPLPPHSSPITLSSEYTANSIFNVIYFHGNHRESVPWSPGEVGEINGVLKNGHFVMVDEEAGVIESEEQAAFHGNGRHL
ncbi:unnamed protein product [Bursaphelenchus xylophilus]|nr:unnamed protein product [Bursaphelenchus xylophilus]CAG9089625.1 unnamed protein product [Bursaphelenchus xylophilus]